MTLSRKEILAKIGVLLGREVTDYNDLTEENLDQLFTTTIVMAKTVYEALSETYGKQVELSKKLEQARNLVKENHVDSNLGT